LFIDAFSIFRHKTTNKYCSFILTHYHSDHYHGLPRDGKYVGPALIHCTPITARLLIHVHGVPEKYVVEHEYGVTWNLLTHSKSPLTHVTFYDANHCPGAAIVFVTHQTSTNNTTAVHYHLHTGDMRYHPKMREYPLLKHAVEQRLVEAVYLDTTYAHPKHDFAPQDEVIQSVATQIEMLVGNASGEHCSSSSSNQTENTNRSNNTLILVSCYSIGKEKLLWEASSKTNQLIYVSEKKRRLLDCLQENAHSPSSNSSSSIAERCTSNPSESDIHVISMGMAGTIFPYFKPNYNACAEYASKQSKYYTRVVTFIPTGWAEASNWNKKNSISSEFVTLESTWDEKQNSRKFHVEFRLVAYSEHSSFAELLEFVQYIKPIKVIPTVFSDEKDRRTIEHRFRNLVDTQRAKISFFSFMNNNNPNNNSTLQINIKCVKRSPSPSSVSFTKKSSTKEENEEEAVIGIVDEVNDSSPCESIINARDVRLLVSMGFDEKASKAALLRKNGSVEDAVDFILSGSSVMTSGSSSLKKENVKSSPPITDFFQKRARR